MDVAAIPIFGSPDEVWGIHAVHAARGGDPWSTFSEAECGFVLPGDCPEQLDVFGVRPFVLGAAEPLFAPT